MNIFVTNTDPVRCAQEHCDRHTVKMILESAQMLSTAHHLCGESHGRLYKKTHENHPCSIWVRQTSGNYEWLKTLYSNLCDIYKQTRGRVHKTDENLSRILSEIPSGIPKGELTKFPMAMPEEFKSNNVEISYQRYLNAKFSEWLLRDRPLSVTFPIAKPEWVKLSLQNN